MALINKSDFSTYVQFTQNITDRMLDFFILKAETLDFKPTVPAAFWSAINSSSPAMGAELTDFFEDYCKPVLVHQAFLRFLVEHGTNITQYGIINPQEDTSQPASPESRASMRNAYKSDLQSYLAKFYARLKEMNYTLDGTVYDFGCKPKKQRLFISAI